ncbi:MAG: bifunctional acetate--CoA ligase family protein/GNAT family N-acetyltransferase [Candidatus Bathyarchaeia archaeon]
MGIENLSRIFNPKSIAVVGASERQDAVGGKILNNLKSLGYQGAIFPVNAFRQTVQGIAAYPSVTKIPSKVDLAVIATPAHTVPQLLEECGEAGVLGIIIVSAGFREAGRTGFELEKRIVEYQKKYGLRIIGANSFGVIRPKINLYASFADKQAHPGKIAFISQSAALCAYALDWASEAQIGFSAVVSTGSMLDVDLGDLIDYFGVDPETRSIVLYVESVKNARKFMSAARSFTRNKPIIVVKAGRFKESIEAALSHSGSMVGEAEIYDAAFKRAGIVRVEAIRELFNCAEALAMQPNPADPHLTIITNAGGPAIMATDSLVAKGGKLAQFSDETRQALKEALPSYCSISNPLDIYEDATPERFRKAIEICARNPGSDSFLVIYTPQGNTTSSELAQLIVDFAKQTKKTVFTALMSEDSCCLQARRFLRRNGVPAFTAPEEAVATFMYMHEYAKNLALLYQTPQELTVEPANTPLLKGILRRAFCEGRKVLTLPECMQFLREYKIPTAKTFVATTREEAVALASEIGYPVVMKALSLQATHKFKVGMVKLNVCSPAETANAFDELAIKIKNYTPAEFQGVAVQPMLRERGYELLVGSKKDRQFGSVIVFGMGGTETEFFRDAAVGFPPLNQAHAKALIEETKIYKQSVASGWPLNEKLLEEVLVRFSRLVLDFPEITEIDINPLIVSGNEAAAVDVRMILDWERMMREVADHQDPTVIAAYPQKYNLIHKLGAETEATLRPIKPEDETRFCEFLMSLSKETMRFRFFQILKEIPHETLTRYCNLDYDREIAIVAELKDSKKIIGAGGVIVEPDGKTGEFAVLVGDQWQGCGLGSKLMDGIVNIARELQLEKVFGYVLADNSRMLRLCEKKGFKIESCDEDVAKLTLTLRQH